MAELLKCRPRTRMNAHGSKDSLSAKGPAIPAQAGGRQRQVRWKLAALPQATRPPSDIHAISKRMYFPVVQPLTFLGDSLKAVRGFPDDARRHAGFSAMVAAEGWTQTEAARRCGVTQPRMNDMLRGRISRFSLDALVNMAAASGRQVHIELVAA